MTAAIRRPSGPAEDLLRELRTLTGDVERYVGHMSHVHHMHRTDLSAISMVMDGGGASPKEISAALRLSPSATSAMLDRLERAGHVERRRSEADRRGVEVQVTDSARAVGASMFGLLGRHMRDALEGVDEADLVRATEIMRRLGAAAREAAQDAPDLS